MGPARPPAVNECAQQIIPSLILLFDGLKRAYAAKAAESDDDENDDEESDLEEGNPKCVKMNKFRLKQKRCDYNNVRQHQH